jgi:hypothetical protein
LRSGIFIPDTHAFNLMKNRIMCSIDLISSVAIPKHEEMLNPFPEQFRLVRTRMSPQHMILIHIERIRRLPRNMIGLYEQIIKALFNGNLWIELIKRDSIWKVSLYSVSYVEQGMSLSPVQTSIEPRSDRRRDVPSNDSSHSLVLRIR